MEISGIEPAVVDRLADEASKLLADLIRIDTSNPPGGETRVAEFLDRFFQKHGLQGEIVGEPAERRSYVLRVEGDRPGPTLLLLAHTDVVPAEPAEWSVPPFDGVIKDDYVWGRGAADIKNLVAAHALATLRLVASGTDFAGTLIYAATSDEEEGSVGGAHWLTRSRPDLVRCDFLLNEGGGEFSENDDGRLYEINTGEKGTAQFRLTVRGEAGHASVPMRRGNAVVAAADIVRALHDYRPRIAFDAVPRTYVERLVEDTDLCAALLDEATAGEALVALGERDPDLATLIAPHYGITLSPTIIHSSSEAVNVYPQEVRLSVDCRMLAGHKEDAVLEEVKLALADVDAEWELEFLMPVRGNSSPYPTPYSAAVDRVMERFVPGSQVVPVHSVGFTDSNWFREAFPEVIAYNFSPYLVDDASKTWHRYHGVDECIHVRDLAFQTLFAEALARELLV
jgi:acetylornithine deacetylase/succinyl-diaminopimelate desuccinylase-like protein